jgi:hypothetical protein
MVILNPCGDKIMESGMLVLLLVLGGLMVYMLFSPTSLIGPWLDKFCKKEDKWTGEDVGESPFKIQEKVPFTPSLDVPFNDPEVPNRPIKKKPKKKRVYKRRKKK